MFISAEWICGNTQTGSVYKLIDSDFEIESISRHYTPTNCVADIIIKEYGKRNLDIVRNLFLYNVWLSNHWNSCSIQESMRLQKEWIPDFDKYYDQLKDLTDKYMSLK